MWATGAVATHALARAALHDGEKPLLADAAGVLVPTDPVSLFPELGVRLAAPLKSEIVEEEAPEEPEPNALADGGYGSDDGDMDTCSDTCTPLDYEQHIPADFTPINPTK